MYHGKGQRACLLCHLAVNGGELVATASDDARQPLFRPHKDVFCQKVHCLLCVSGRGPSSHCIHRGCYQYFRRFSPSSTVRLRDLLELWPCFPNFLEQNRDREKHTYKEYFNHPGLGRLLSRSSSHGAENNLMDILRLMINKLPTELLSYIAELSWPCALQKPLIISGESHSLLEFSRREKCNVIDSLVYTGGPVTVTRLNFLGSPYVSSLSIEEKMNRGRQKIPSIALIRNEVGFLDVNLQGKFLLSQRGYWYKRIQTRSDHLHLRVYYKHIITEIEMASVDEEASWNPYWDDQLTPLVSTWYTAKRNSPPPNFMKYTRLRDDAQGVAVLCALDGIVSINIHAQNNKPTIDEGPNHGFSEHTAWIYFPLGKDELITGAWMRELNNDLTPHHPVLVLSTSLKRNCTFGSYIPREHQDQYRYQSLIIRSGHRVTGFCYNDKGIFSSAQTKIGVTHAPLSITGTSPGDCALPDPPFQATHIHPNSRIPQWFKSSGSLVGVRRLRICVDNRKPHKPTVGMMLVYANCQEVLGQWRPDCEVEDFELVEQISFFSGETEKGPYVRIVPDRKMGEGWNNVNHTAEVVWWFTPNCSRIDINE